VITATVGEVFIHLATQIAKHVIKQYIAIIEKEEETC